MFEWFSKNVMSADNQQERLNAGWIVGFTDGEGCFHISINKIDKMKLGWQVLPEFRIVQNKYDEQVLYQIQKYFGFGQITVNRKDHYGVRKEFRDRGLENLTQIIEFFEKHPLQTKSKQENFQLFKQVIEMMEDGQHLKQNGLDKIANIVSRMNRKPKIKYLESSETTRQTSKI